MGGPGKPMGFKITLNVVSIHSSKDTLRQA
jgi:hypothetical protein